MTGRWRLYVCSASKPPSKHWWIDVLEADDPSGFEQAEPRTVFAGDETVGVKDPIVQRTRTAAGRHGSAATRSTSPTRRIA